MSALASAAQNLGAARAQMGLSLGWHIVFACLGVGFPALVLLAEWRGIRGDAASMALARRWAKVAGVLFAVGQVTNPRPLIAMFNHATPVQTAHMILAAFMVTGFAVASVYAAAMLRGRRDRYHTVGLLLPLIVAVAITPAQIVVGDIAAREVAENQPVKLAAMEGLGHAQAGAGEHVGGVYINGELRYAIVLPHVLAFLAKGDANATVA